MLERCQRALCFRKTTLCFRTKTRCFGTRALCFFRQIAIQFSRRQCGNEAPCASAEEHCVSTKVLYISSAKEYMHLLERKECGAKTATRMSPESVDCEIALCFRNRAMSLNHKQALCFYIRALCFRTRALCFRTRATYFLRKRAVYFLRKRVIQLGRQKCSARAVARMSPMVVH